MNGVNKDTSFVVSPSPWFNGTPRLTMQNSAALWTNCQSQCKDSLEDVDFSQKMGHCENVRRGEGPISFGILSSPSPKSESKVPQSRPKGLGLTLKSHGPLPRPH